VSLLRTLTSSDTIKRISAHPVVRNTVFLYAVQISSYIFPLITLPYLSRVLQPANFGLVAFAQSFIFYFITLTEYGFNLTATRKIAVNRDDPKAVSRIFNEVMVAKLFLTVLGFCIMLGIVGAIPKLRADWLLFVVTFLNVLGNWLFPLWFFQGMQRMGQIAARDFIAKLIAMALLFTMVRHQGDYIIAAAIQSGAMAIAGVIGLVSVRSVFPVQLAIPSLAGAFGALRETWPVFLSMAAMTVAGSTNIFILGLWAAPVEVGYYTSAYRLIVAARMLVTPIVTSLYPHISHVAAGSGRAAIAFLRRYSLIMAAPFFLGSLITFVAAGPIVKLLFGAGYAPTTPVLRVLAFSPLFLVLTHTYSTYYMLAFGYDKQWSRIIVTSSILNFAFLFPLLLTIRPAMAVAITGTILDVFSLAACYRFYRRHAARDAARGAVPENVSNPKEFGSSSYPVRVDEIH